jgi:hypothetical protein
MQILAERGGMLEFTTKNLEFSHQMPCDTGGGTAEFIPRVYVLSTNFVTTGPKEIEVRCELLLGGLVMLTEQKTLITDIQLDTSEKIERDPAVGSYHLLARGARASGDRKRATMCPSRRSWAITGLDWGYTGGKTPSSSRSVREERGTRVWKQQHLRAIAQRTQGDIYIGVVGPVRTENPLYQALYGDLVLPHREQPCGGIRP